MKTLGGPDRGCARTRRGAWLAAAVCLVSCLSAAGGTLLAAPGMLEEASSSLSVDAAKASKAAGNTSDAASAAKNTNKASDASSAGKTTSKASSCANSFTPDTPVKTGDGEAKPIGEVRPGDQVLTLDPATGERSAQTVTDVIAGSDRVVVDVGLMDGSVVTTTPGHRLWLPEGREFARADHLTVGDSLSGADGALVVVESVTVRGVASQPMVNLTVAVTHTFYAVTTPCWCTTAASQTTR